jgi:Kef-type K+ transport system membrane component KefB
MTASTLRVRESLFSATLYFLLLIGAVAAFLLIRQVGQTLIAPIAAAPTMVATGSKAPTLDVGLHVLMTLAAIIGLGNLLAWGFRLIGQPAVIGEVVAGILLGPSLLGEFAPDAMHFLIPGADVDPHGLVVASLKTIAQLGVILYMFIVGLELNTRKVGRQTKAAVAISHASIVVPFVSGAALALWLYPILSTSDVPFTSFSLFLGVAMSITAFPILARILTDQQLDQTDLGVIALSCAASDDVTAWCLLAFVVGVAKAQLGSALMVALWTIIFILVMFLIVRTITVHRCTLFGLNDRSHRNPCRIRRIPARRGDSA